MQQTPLVGIVFLSLVIAACSQRTPTENAAPTATTSTADGRCDGVMADHVDDARS